MSQPAIRVEVIVAAEHRNVTPFDLAQALRRFADMIDADVMVVDVATDPFTSIRLPDAVGTMQRLPILP